MLQQTFTFGGAIKAALVLAILVIPAVIGWTVILAFVQQQRAGPDKPMARR